MIDGGGDHGGDHASDYPGDDWGGAPSRDGEAVATIFVLVAMIALALYSVFS